MKFWKMNGAGNDFLIINNLSGKIRPEQWPQIAQTVCERHRSVGADGLMAVEKSDSADYKMLFFNSDGSMGEMCGKYADRIFFTTDNPDFDDPADIAGRLAHAAAQSGPARVTIQLDRTRAVEQAILEAPEGAVIVLAGKGNDAIQRVRGGYVHYDSDPVVAQRALALREKQRT